MKRILIILCALLIPVPGFAGGEQALQPSDDRHMKNLRRKIEPDPKQPTYIHTVYGVGYRLVGP